jgi:hypothetical protein
MLLIYRLKNILIKNKGNYVFFQTLIQGFFGFILSLSIAKLLSVEEQGDYFFIGSIVAFILISDLGYSNLLLIFFSRLKFPQRITLYAHVIKKYKKFSLISIFSLPIFYYFLDDLKIIIGVSAALIAIQFYWPLKIKLALLESSKQLTKSYLIKIVHVIISYPVMFLFLFLGYYYLVAPVFWIVFVAVVYFSTINLDIFHIKDISDVSKEVTDKQNSIFFKSIFELGSSYFLLYFPVILISTLFGKEIGGKFGLTLITLNFALVFSTSWFRAAIPSAINSIHSSNWLKNIQSLRINFYISAFLFVLVISFIYIIFYLLDIENRLLEIILFCEYVIIFFLYHYLSFQIIAQRASLKDNISVYLFLTQLFLILVFYFILRDQFFYFIHLQLLAFIINILIVRLNMVK